MLARRFQRLQRIVHRHETPVARLFQVGLDDVGHHRFVVDHHDRHVVQPGRLGRRQFSVVGRQCIEIGDGRFHPAHETRRRPAVLAFRCQRHARCAIDLHGKVPHTVADVRSAGAAGADVASGITMRCTSDCNVPQCVRDRCHVAAARVLLEVACRLEQFVVAHRAARALEPMRQRGQFVQLGPPQRIVHALQLGRQLHREIAHHVAQARVVGEARNDRSPFDTGAASFADRTPVTAGRPQTSARPPRRCQHAARPDARPARASMRSMSTGLVRKPVKPAASISCSKPFIALAVSASTGTRDPRSRSRRVAV